MQHLSKCFLRRCVIELMHILGYITSFNNLKILEIFENTTFGNWTCFGQHMKQCDLVT
jgi:hypothetical protein